MDGNPIDVTWRSAHHMLMPRDPDKDQKYRINTYVDWLARTHRPWFRPDFAAYRDYLLNEREKVNPHTGAIIPATLAPRTVLTHLATIRGRYEVLLRDNDLREMLYGLAPPKMGPADKKAFVDEVLIRLENAVHPRHAPVKTLTIQDEADSAHLRLTVDQLDELLRAPGISTLPGLRDTAIIAVFACTGVREAELTNLRLDDLRQRLDDELALRVREGKNYKQRLVPYGPLDWCLTLVDRWLDKAGITSGYVFRGFYKGYKKIRPTGISNRAINLIMNQYAITVDGTLRTVNPHDLRRTYARRAYEHGMDIERIRQNLGHVNMATTLGYIGALDGSLRRPPNMFRNPYTSLDLRRGWDT